MSADTQFVNLLVDKVKGNTTSDQDAILSGLALARNLTPADLVVVEQIVGTCVLTHQLANQGNQQAADAYAGAVRYLGRLVDEDAARAVLED